MMNIFKPQGMIPPNAEGGVDIDAAMDHEIARIQAGLGDTLIMRDPCICCTGRIDLGNRFAQKLKASAITMTEVRYTECP